MWSKLISVFIFLLSSDILFQRCFVIVLLVIGVFDLTWYKQGLVVAIATQLLPRDGGTVEDHGAPEAKQLPRAWTRGCRERKSSKRASGAKSP